MVSIVFTYSGDQNKNSKLSFLVGFSQGNWVNEFTNSISYENNRYTKFSSTFVLRIVTWSCNCLLNIIINYLKSCLRMRPMYIISQHLGIK